MDVNLPDQNADFLFGVDMCRERIRWVIYAGYTTSKTIWCHFTEGHDLVNHYHAELTILTLYVLRYIWCLRVTNVAMETQQYVRFLGAFAKLRKATISFAMSVCPHGTARLSLDGISLNLIFGDFSEICLEYSSLIKI